MKDLLLSPEIQEIVLSLILAIIGIVIPILTERIVVLLNSKIAEGKAKLSASQLAILNLVVGLVVQSVEKSVENGKLMDLAQAKKAQAIAKVQAHLNSLGLTGIHVGTIEDAIEAAIKQGIEKGFPELSLLEAIELED